MDGKGSYFFSVPSMTGIFFSFSLMLRCDFCHKWFHGACVGQHGNRNNHDWECPLCCPVWTGRWRKRQKIQQKKRSGKNVTAPEHPKGGPGSLAVDTPQTSKEVSLGLKAAPAKTHGKIRQSGGSPWKVQTIEEAPKHPTTDSVKKELFHDSETQADGSFPETSSSPPHFREEPLSSFSNLKKVSLSSKASPAKTPGKIRQSGGSPAWKVQTIEEAPKQPTADSVKKELFRDSITQAYGSFLETSSSPPHVREEPVSSLTKLKKVPLHSNAKASPAVKIKASPAVKTQQKIPQSGGTSSNIQKIDGLHNYPTNDIVKTNLYPPVPVTQANALPETLDQPSGIGKEPLSSFSNLKKVSLSSKASPAKTPGKIRQSGGSPAWKVQTIEEAPKQPTADSVKKELFRDSITQANGSFLGTSSQPFCVGKELPSFQVNSEDVAMVSMLPPVGNNHEMADQRGGCPMQMPEINVGSNSTLLKMLETPFQSSGLGKERILSPLSSTTSMNSTHCVNVPRKRSLSLKKALPVSGQENVCQKSGSPRKVSDSKINFTSKNCLKVDLSKMPTVNRKDTRTKSQAVATPQKTSATSSELSPDFKVSKNRSSSLNSKLLSPDFKVSKKRSSSLNSNLRPEKKSSNPPPDLKIPKKTPLLRLPDQYSCQYCQLPFKTKSNCNRHEIICSGSSIPRGPQHTCPNCSSTFNRKDNLKSHLRSCSGIKSVKCTSSMRRSPCLVEECGLDFYHKISLIEHLQLMHKDVSLKEVQHLKFDSIERFNEWKEQEEATTFSYFCQKKGQEKSRIKHYYCQHDGSGKCHSERKTPRRKTIGRIKVGHFCISKMKVWKNENHVIEVEYFPTHSHICKAEDLHHQPLPRSLDRFINQQLAWGVSPSTIFDNVRKSIPRNSDNVGNLKSNLVTRKRIRERARKRREALRLHKDDAKAVYLLVKQLIDEEDCILLYKPYGSPVVHGPPEIDNLPQSNELFLLGIQTKRQQKLMEELAGKIIVVDETHSTNPYKYQLLTVLVVDDNRRGWPVGHLITSKSDADTLQYFWKAMKDKTNCNLNINCVITDDDAALINSMNQGFDTALISSMNLGFSQQLRHLLCIWHVIKNFKDNLRGKVASSLVEPMLQELRVLINCKDQNLFHQLSKGFVNKYKTNPSASKFINYFETYYMKRTEKWAMCFRNFPHGEVNTTGHIESFHHRLKKVHLKRKVNRRLDDLVTILLNIEWEDHCTRIREASHGLTVLPQHIFERHERGIKIIDSDVSEVLEQTWEVKATTSSTNLKYVVVRHSIECSADLCFSKCTNASCPGLCSHMYYCSCPDTHPLCKHIHKVHAMTSKGLVTSNNINEFYILPTVESTTAACSTEEPQDTPPKTDQKLSAAAARLEKNMNILGNFILSVHEKKIDTTEVSHVDAVLNDIILRIQHLKENTDTIQEVVKMKPAVKYASNEKLKSQVLQLSSFRRPPKKKKKTDPAEIARQKASVIENLLGFNEEESTVDDPPSTSSSSNAADPSSAVSSSNVTDPSSAVSSSYVADPSDFVLFCGSEKISLIHLKSLELNLPLNEKDLYQSRDPIFQVGWLYSSIINAFFYKMSKQFKDVFLMSSDLAIRASRYTSNVTCLQKLLTSLRQMRVIFLPANLNNMHWTIVVILPKEKKVFYYDPLQTLPVSAEVSILLAQVVSDMRTLFPSPIEWEIHIVKMQKQTDSINCGPNICHFGEQVAKCEPPSYVRCHHTYRKHMYSTIVGGCLKRAQDCVEHCGICSTPYGSDKDNTTVWVCCSQCQQWYHTLCVGYSNNSGTNFVCPL